MDARDPQPIHLLITRSGRVPSANDVKELMVRLGVEDLSEAAVEQLIRAGAAADRWLADHPDEAAGLVKDPAGAVEAMRQSGLLADPVADLLEVLRSLSGRRDTESTRRSRLARILRPTTVRFGDKPVLRSKSPRYGGPKPCEGGS